MQEKFSFFKRNRQVLKEINVQIIGKKKKKKKKTWFASKNVQTVPGYVS